MILFFNHCYSVSILYDIETNEFLHEITDPIIKAAKIEKKIKFYIINENQNNAFTDGIDSIYIYTGLILNLEKPEELIGVLAHELAHIKAEHYILTSSKIESLKKLSFLIMGAGVLSLTATQNNRYEIASAVLGSGFGALHGSFAQFSREEEAIADMQGMNFLAEAGYDPKMILDSIKQLKKISLFSSDCEINYFSTHPTNRDRIKFLKVKLREFEKKPPINQKILNNFQKIQAKLFGFTENENFLRNKLNGELLNHSLIVFYKKQGNFEKSLNLINLELKNTPNNFYLINEKAENYFYQGKIDESICEYRKIIDRTDDYFLKINYIKLLILSNINKNLIKARILINSILIKDPNNILLNNLMREIQT